MTLNTSVIPDLAEVTIWACKKTGSSVEVVIDNTSHVFTAGTVSRVESTLIARLVAGHTSVNDVLTVVTSRTCLIALCVEWVLVVFLACVVCTCTAFCALLKGWAET